MFATKGAVPEGEYTLPFGVADVKREGEDVTIVATSSMVYVALEAAELLAEEGVSAEVVDPRTTRPLDRETLIASAAKTGRALVVDEGHRSFGASAELAAVIAEGAFWELEAPVRRLAAMDVPIPFSPVLEDLTVPTPERARRGGEGSHRKEVDDGIRTYGTMQVDWERRADLDRLRRERLARAKAHLADSELGALLCFDMSNIRYITATHIGTWAMDKLIRFCLLPQGDEPIMWDFGSAARHHKLYSPWLGEERSRAGISTLRGAVRRTRRGRRAQDPGRARGAWAPRRAARRRRDRAARARGAAGRGRTGRRRPVAHAGRPQDQDGGRDHAPGDGMRDGRRGLRRALPRAASRHARERVRRARQPGAVSSSGPSTSRA